MASGGLVWLAGWLLKYFGGVPGATDAVRHEATVQAWMCVILVMAAVMILLAIYHWRMLPSGGAAAAETKSAGETLEKLQSVIRDFFQKRHIGYYIAFIILYRLPRFRHEDCSPFLEGGTFGGRLRLMRQEIGLYYGTYGAAAFVLGSLLAGYYISHRGLRKRCSPCAASLTCLLWHIPVSDISAGERHADWQCHRAGVFRLRLRLCGAFAVYDATGSSGQAPDGALCFSLPVS